MTSHEPPEPCATCGKRVYRTWRHASYDARAMCRTRTGQRGKRAYWSPACRCYHVGSVLTKTRKRRRRKGA